ncbi:FAD:protein FMN transferase [Gehongia tenuis]|uniref:FAD:protein FMN transferase n=1 Tax=Gehongia tenuis TaxID=2763655 RepID=A0A926HPX3_9FIRM|nr:FAD:protein FMN transferase [Gehongia tenuis]MBC8532114.1 FAD:protein FMN transferase [Gehongia tenuis]
MRNDKRMVSHPFCVFMALGLLLLSGCAKDAAVQRDAFAMDTFVTVTAYGVGGEDVEGALELLEELDRLWDVHSKESEVSAVNRHQPVQISQRTEELLQKALEVGEASGGFNVRVRPLVRAWGEFKTGSAVPGEREIEEARAYLSAEFKVAGGRAFLAEGEIDLGGIAKGAAVSEMLEDLRGRGAKAAVVDLGGNVGVMGEKKDGFRIGLQDPLGETGEILGVLRLTDGEVVATSGGYQRYFEADGVRYHHVLDPNTGYPAKSGLASVSVVAADGALADGLSTACFVEGLEAGKSLLEHFGAEGVFVMDDGTVELTAGLTDRFEEAP